MNKDIAIIGMAGRFPDAGNLDELLENLEKGKDSVKKISPQRLKATTLAPNREYRVCGYLEDIDKFDFKFFNISPGEAQAMAPEQRILLEIVHEAIENGGYPIDELAGSNTAVFLAGVTTDYYKHADEFSQTLMTGNSPDYMAARISRELKLEGSSTMINTSCSSSLAAVYFACSELLLGNTENALVCGVNLALFPYKNTTDSELESPDGRSMAFSANANGMSFGELAAAVWLKPLAKALEDKDIIHAVIKGTAMNNNAHRSASPTAPDSVMQAKAIRETWKKSGVKPTDIGYIEAHGSGTKLGDSLEIEGLNLAFAQCLEKKNFTRVPISTIKSNTGHGRAASGLAGLIKTVLCLKHRVIFPIIHFEEPSPLIDFSSSAVYVNKKLKKWEPANGKTRTAGVTSVGASGINCHTVLAEAPVIEPGAGPLPREIQEKAHLITVSSKSADGLINNIKALARKLSRERYNHYHLADIAYTLNRGRKHYPYRAAFIATHTETLVKLLEEAESSPLTPELKMLIFILSDHDEIPGDMLNHLLTSHILFKQVYEGCRELSPDPGDNRFYDFAFQYSFYRLLAAYGITTGNVLGIGIGRIIYSVISGDITLEQGIKQVYTYKKEKIGDLESRVNALLQRETGKDPVAFIEMGPGGILANALKKKQSSIESRGFYVFDFPGEDHTAVHNSLLLELIKWLYLARFEIDWQQYHCHHPGRKLDLPGYQFDRTRCWLREEPRLEFAGQTAAAPPAGAEKPVSPLKEQGSEIEEKIAGYWAEVLEIKQYSPEDNFFEIGGDSLKTTKIINRINQEFNLELSFEDMFDFPTIRQLGEYISSLWGTEQKVARIWKKVLKYEKIEPDDHFFELGGHSLMANQVLNAIKKQFHLELDFEDFFRHPTLISLSQLIDKRLSIGQDKVTYEKIESVEKKEYFPLSSAQKRMYLVHRMDPTGMGYNTLVTFSLEEDLDKNRVEAALKQLIRRQESLRTSFEIIDDEPVQRIHACHEVDFALDYYELSRERAREKISQYMSPFDLKKAPLIRVGLIKTSPEQYIVLLEQHHIVTDGTSGSILFRQFMEAYEGKELPPLPIHYKDFSEWQNHQLQTGKMRKQQEYWLAEFEGEIPVLNIPLDYPRPVLKSFEGSMMPFNIGDKHIAFLKQLARQKEVTLFMVLTAIINIFLAKISGQEDICMGTPVVGRRRTELEEIIGMFVNTLVIRAYPAAHRSFTTLLQEIKEKTVAAFENQDYPFEELVDKRGLNRDTSRNPLFDVMFSLHNFESANADSGMVRELDPVSQEELLENVPARFDLVFHASENREQVRFFLEYHKKLFKKQTIQRFTRYFNRLISSVMINPAQKIFEIDILPGEEKQQLIMDFNNTAEDFPTDKTIYQLFEEQVDNIPDTIAVVGSLEIGYRTYRTYKTYITYKKLDKKANQLANYLVLEKGVRIGDRLAVLMERSPELIISLMGVMKAGGAYVPLDPGLPGERLRVVFNDASIGVVISQEKFKEKLLSLIKPGVPGFHSLLCIDDQWDEIGQQPFTRPGITGAGNPAYVMYTSGSSGTPKGVLVEHRTIVNTLIWRKNFYEYQPGNASLQIPPYFFDSSVTDIFTPLLGGARLVLVSEDERIDLAMLKEVIPANNVSHFIAVPAFYNVLLEEIADYLKYVKMICCAGEHFPDELIRKHFEKLPGIRIVNEYGPTENSVNTTAYNLVPDSPRALIGKPVSNVAVTIRDRRLGLCPIGVTGEMCLSGAGLSRGYLNNPEMTYDKFKIINYELPRSNKKFLWGGPGGAVFSKRVPPGRRRLYRTGDLGRWLPDGNLEFLGRADTQVKIRGIRVETGEIENHLLRRNDIKEVVALACDSGGGDKYLCAYVVLAGINAGGGKKDFSVDLKEYLAEKLPEYMIPSYFIIIDAIPFTSSGKINREELPRPDISTAGSIVPRDGVERELARIWSEVLDIPLQTLGIDSNFFQLGGHSLRATIAASRIHKAFNVNIPLTEVFKTPTIRGLARYISAARQEQYTAIEPTEEKEYYPLSPAQKRLFMLQRLVPDHTVYNLPMVVPFPGALDKHRLEWTFRKLIRRHESLRTSVEMIDAEPVQRIHKEVEFKIQHIDSITKDTEEENHKLQITNKKETAGHHSSFIIHHSFVRPFDLTKAPLLRVGLMQNLLLVDMHHIITDGVSHAILKKEFHILYTGKPGDLPPLRLQYKDYARWQHNQTRRALIKQQEAYWLKMFAGEVPVLSLPTDFPVPLIRSFAGCTVEFQLTVKETQTIKTLAGETNTTLFMCLLAVFTILISKLSGQEDIIIGTPVAGRRHTDLEPIVGMFVNMLATRNQPAGEKGFKKFLPEVKECTLNAYENQEYPFEELVDKLNVVRDTGRNPIFDAAFNLMNFEEYQGNLPGGEEADSYPYTHQESTSKFDLTLTAVDTGERLVCAFEYCTELFEPGTIERFITYFKKILALLWENSDRRLWEFDITTESEKQRILYEFNDTLADYPKDKTVHQLFEEQVQRTPDNIALHGCMIAWMHGEDVSITYKELNQKADQLVYILIEKGVHPDTIVGIMLERSLEMIIGILAILKAGGAYLPIDPDYPEERISYLLSDSRANLLVTTHTLAEVDGNFSSLPSSHPHLSLAPATYLAYIIYTSGSTGKPKGVIVEHRSLVNLCTWHNAYFRVSERDRVTQYASIGFDASVWEIFPYLVKGASLYIIVEEIKLDPHRLNAYYEKNDITIGFLPTPVCQQFMDHDNRSLRMLLTGGDKLRVFKQRNYTLHNNYGPTENTVVATAFPVDKEYDNIPIGKPVYNNRIYILNPDYLTVQPIGAAGELCIGGDSLARGYLNNPELSNKKLLRGVQGGGFLEKSPPGRRRQKLYRTGDLARWLPDGNIQFLGRSDDQVKIRGYRVELGEIENHIMTYPGIKETVVLNLSDRDRQYLCAYFSAARSMTGERVPVQQLKAYLEGKLPAYMVPACFVQIEKIPLNPNGKVQHNLLPQPLEADFHPGGTYKAPETNVQQIIAETWQEILGREKVGVQDNFFDLGGNSLDIVKLSNKLKEKLNREIPLVTLFTYPTISSLERHLAGEGEEFVSAALNMKEIKIKNSQTGQEIAVIGMAGRFPQANDINTFWENLKNGVESVTFFADKELLETGIAQEIVKNPNYVKAKGYLEDIRYFDSTFFNYTPKEAEIMDPQVRVFHECAWHALENAGYDPQSYNGLIGLYAGYTPNIAWKIGNITQIKGSSELMEIEYLNSFYFSTLLCYKLNLKGTGMTINTACSTSLAAIHLACRALITREADIVLAGGVSITLPTKTGYLYEEGMVLSPDGHCRPFDAKANGTASGNGVGIVVLKPLAKAVQDRDHIYAVIKGTAINNDGNRKAGYTAPSVEAQAEVIRAAQRMARVETGSIAFIETHGTGTPLGDPIEFAALKKVFMHTGKKRFCRLGTLKANIGHLDAAAGAAGFIKTVLALKHRLIPPAVNFHNPNPEIDFENSPFYINKDPEEWKSEKFPLRAGVSSFGIGGTNVHVVLEEWPDAQSAKRKAQSEGGAYQLILLSAKTETALQRITENLANYFKKNPQINLADAAYTLLKGRQACNYRRMLVCRDSNEAIDALLSAAPGKARNYFTDLENRPVVFMFPGLGTQYVNMGRGLYHTEPIFRETMDRCFQILKPLMGYDLKEILYPGDSVSKVSGPGRYVSTRWPDTVESPLERGTPDPRKGGGVFNINQFENIQAVIFIFEYALVQLLIKWGIKPHSLIGYSFGEYTAACISGVFSLEDALKLVTLRSRLIKDIPAGSMLSVPLPAEKVKPLLNEHIDIAIDNGDSCIAAGPTAAVDAFEKQMKKKRYLCIPLEASHALHTRMMDTISHQFEAQVGQLTLNQPGIPFISNVTGKWITPGDAVNPRYWAVHLRETVRFSQGLQELMGIENAVFLEVGPGVVLSTLAHQYIQKESNHTVVNLVRARDQKIPDEEYLLKKIGGLWLYGTRIDRTGFHANEKRNRIPLPAYPFDKLSHRVNLPMQNLLPIGNVGEIKLGSQEPMPPVPTYTRPEKNPPYAAPRDKAEELFVRMWEDILGTRPIGVHDNLLEMGVNSLKGITFVNRFKEQLGEIIHITAIFDAPTAAELAAYFSKHYPESFARVIGRQTSEETGQPLLLTKQEVSIEKIMRLRRFLPLTPEPLGLDTPRNPRAVFVLSPPRTGSTLLRVILGGHPGLFAPPELNLLSFNTLVERKNVFAGPGQSNLQGAIRAIMTIKKCSAQQAEEMIENFENQGMTVKEFYRQLQKWIGNQVLVDKSPGYTNDLDILKRAELYFQDPLYIHLLRHPYGMIHSFVEARMDLLTGQQTTTGLSLTRRELAEVIYANSLYNILEFLKQVPPGRQLSIKFEDLATKAEDTTKAICRFLDLEFHPQMLQPYKEKKKRMTDGVYSQGQMIGDMKFHQHKNINAKVADSWRKDYKEDFLGRPTLEIAGILGYKSIHEAARGPADPGNLLMLNGVSEAEGNIFFIHERSGDVGGYIEFCNQLGTLGTRFNCWGIQAEKLKNYTPQNVTIEETSARYIDQIKKIQPRGPYYLCAWSFGGNITFEMTRQLEQMGERTALLAFIDCAGPLGRIREDTREFTLETEKSYIKEFFSGSEIGAILGKITDIDHIWPFVVDFLRSSNVHTDALKNFLRGYENAIPDYQNLGAAELIQFLNLDRTFKNAGAGYIPAGKIRTPIHFFKASQSGGTYNEYWNEYCTTPVIYHEVKGDHHSIFKQPDVKEFVRLFNEILENIN